MILVNNVILTDKIRQSFIDSDGEQFWKDILEVIGKKYGFTPEELDSIIRDGNEVLV